MATSQVNCLPKADSREFLDMLEKQHGKYECLDGVSHGSMEGEKRMFNFYCDNVRDGLICVFCWAIDSRSCNFDEDFS